MSFEVYIFIANFYFVVVVVVVVVVDDFVFGYLFFISYGLNFQYFIL